MPTITQDLTPLSAAAPLPPRGDAGPADASEPGGGSTGLLSLAALLLTALWVLIVVMIRVDDRNTREQVQTNLRNLSRAFSEHTAKTIQGADQAVRFVRSEVLQKHQALDIPKYLASQAIIDDDYHLLTVIGADGYVTHSSQPFTRVDLHEREHFRVHATGGPDTLFVSKPVLGKVSKKWSIQITRRITEADGSFGGVVVVSMPPNYFTRFFQDVDLGPQGVIALVGTDGHIRARASKDGEQQGQDIAQTPVFKHMQAQRNGVVQMASSVDGVERIYAFRTLDEYKLIVVAGMGAADAFDEFQDRRRMLLVSGALVTLVIGIFVANLHVRARRQAQLMQELRGSRLKAVEANQLKSRFLASVSHELRTPLNGILGYAELVRDMAGEPQIAEFGGVIHDSARHLHSLVNTILDLAKIETGHMVTHFSTTEVPALLEETHRLHSVHAQARGLSFSLQIDPSCPHEVETDRTRLLQVLSNVVNNAIKFTEQGDITLTASGEAGRLQLRLRDQGIGIAPDRLATLFTRFQGVSSELVHSNQGAGLGLPLAKELIEMLGGTLVIQSVLGQGTEVCISLPVTRQQRPQEPPPESEKAR